MSYDLLSPGTILSQVLLYNGAPNIVFLGRLLTKPRKGHRLHVADLATGKVQWWRTTEPTSVVVPTIGLNSPHSPPKSDVKYLTPRYAHVVRKADGRACQIEVLMARFDCEYPAPKAGDIVHAERRAEGGSSTSFYKVVNTLGGVWLAPASFVIRETGPYPLDVELTEDVDIAKSFVVDERTKLKGVVCARSATHCCI